MVLDIFQTNTRKKSSTGVFPIPAKLGWKLDWELKTMSPQQQQLKTVFKFYQLVFQQTASPQCGADMYPGGDECPSAIKWGNDSFTLWLLLLLATELTVYSYNDLALSLSSSFWRVELLPQPPPTPRHPPSPFWDEKWSSVKSCDCTRRAVLLQICTGSPLSSGELQVYYWKRVYYYGRHISAARVDHWRSLSYLARARVVVVQAVVQNLFRSFPMGL